jgi:hypothetical protein
MFLKNGNRFWDIVSIPWLGTNFIVLPHPEDIPICTGCNKFDRTENNNKGRANIA